MSIAGVTAEFDPFHNGHAFLLEKAREGADAVVCVMSGDFTERGATALIDKRKRALAALSCGADMVLELPCPMALSPAELFAQTAVSILHGTGIVDEICFGSESGDTELIRRAALIADTEDERFAALLRDRLSRGMSFPSARHDALRIYGADDAVLAALSSPNDTLGAEYCRAAARLGMSVRAIPREGAAHDSSYASGRFMSGSAIRSAVLNGGDVSAFVPGITAEQLTEPLRATERLFQPLLYRLRTMTADGIAALPDVSEGLENPIAQAAVRAKSYNELLSLIKTKRYTLARLRRILMCALIGIESGDRLTAPYIRVLGVRKNALSLLSLMSKNAALPVIVSYADTDGLSAAQVKLLDIEQRASDISALAQIPFAPSVSEFSHKLIIV